MGYYFYSTGNSRNRVVGGIQHLHQNVIGSFPHSGGTQFLSSGSTAPQNHVLNHLPSLNAAIGPGASIEMECESPRLSASTNNQVNHQLGSVHLQQRGSGVANIPGSINASHPHHMHLIRTSGSSSGSTGTGGSSRHMVGPVVLDSGPVSMSGALSSRYITDSSGGPASIPTGVDFSSLANSNNSVSSYPSYLNMNLSNGPPPTSSLDCTQTGSLNMPLVSGISATNAAGVPSFNMNLNLAGHHVSLGGLNPSISSSSNGHHTQQSSAGFHPPPSQFISSMMPPYVGSNAVGVGINASSSGSASGGGSGGGGGGGVTSHHHHGGSSESGSSASSSDLGLNGGKNNLLMSLSSRGGRQGPMNTNSSEDDRDRDESPMVCAQQSPVASH